MIISRYNLWIENKSHYDIMISILKKGSLYETLNRI